MGACTLASVTAAGVAPWNADRNLVIAKVTWSASYATGGDTVAVATLGLRSVYKVWAGGDVDPYYDVALVAVTQMAGGSYEVRLAGTAVSPTLKLMKGGTSSAEETNATNVSTINTWVVFEGNV